MTDDIAPLLDHVVVNARDGLKACAENYRRMGFFLTPPSRHTLGSMNQTAVFGDDYLELLGIDREAAEPRLELMRTPLGLEGLVFKAADADSVYASLAARGVAASAPVTFSRPTVHGEARFRVVRLSGIPFGRCYFCQHLTPELVWREEWRRHPNGATRIARVVIAARDPEALRALFHRIFGPAFDGARIEIVKATEDGIARLEIKVTRDAGGYRADPPLCFVDN
jgi:hypothetical protein